MLRLPRLAMRIQPLAQVANALLQWAVVFEGGEGEGFEAVDRIARVISHAEPGAC
jgi:hypothetical protein